MRSWRRVTKLAERNGSQGILFIKSGMCTRWPGGGSAFPSITGPVAGLFGVSARRVKPFVRFDSVSRRMCPCSQWPPESGAQEGPFLCSMHDHQRSRPASCPVHQHRVIGTARKSSHIHRIHTGLQRVYKDQATGRIPHFQARTLLAVVLHEHPVRSRVGP